MKPSRKPTPKPTRPAPTTTPGTGTPTVAGCPQGQHQRAVETYLTRLGGFGAVTVDGRQSAADCAAIKKFQKRYGIRPVEGRAGPTTLDVAQRLATTDTTRCKAGTGTTFCVDLTRQTVWALRGGKVIMAPTVTRTGMSGYRTPAGTYAVNYRNPKEWSNPYEVWLPYWQHFTQGMGFHETTTYLHDKSIGSHGCVNLLHADAVRMWELGKVGTRVVLIGRRPGT
ncbi:L,D-transpeptidase family protein [Micromonospora arida]|uniref:L,D-transpeptidase family protein n=1 Tax=Micromonospora arida TaxID=2203715 RepID=UPI001FC923A3|nr:L,D-transpeptidase family protein [Micromonospora arida]